MKLVWWLVVACSTVGCMPSGSTAGGSALVHPNFPYGAGYDDVSTKSVMGDEWKLETYRRKRKQTANAPSELERKDGYLAKYEFDFDDDDQADASAKLPIPDLLFVNKRTNAKLEVVTLLLDTQHAQKELRLLLNDVVESGSGTRSLFVGFGRSAAGVSKRMGSRLVDSQEASLGGQAGLVATIENADLDQLQLNPNARSRRTRLFLMRAPFDYYVREGTGSGNTGPTYHRYRVLMMVEYSNTPEDFDQQYPEFLRLMNKLHLIGDLRMLAYLQALLTPCSKAKNAHLILQISPLGRAEVREVSEIDRLCAERVVAPYPFAATGESRVINGSYDFSQPAPRADWLDQGEYQEARASAPPPPAPTPVPAEAAPAAPAASTAPAPTAPAPAAAASSPPAPSAPAPSAP